MKKSNGSVPRNRVFTCYNDRCNSVRIKPLNPASFGKLVRIIHPDVQTRRLGNRGESKYNYVDLSIVLDSGDSNTQAPPRAPSQIPAKPVLKETIKSEKVE